MTFAIEADDLRKTFTGKQDVVALDGVGFEVEEGTVFGLLGPNGAGKTTAVRVLTTILRPDSGTARVLGHDVTREPALVRTLIGLAGQYAAVDENLTGRENLTMVGRLNHLPRAYVAGRARDLLEQFDLAGAANRSLKTYSGGMRRRLDLAASLMTRPPVLFLDEPTTGLDPTSRSRVWDAIRELIGEGVTVLLTTQYLEEADELAHQIVVVDHGRVIADGTPQSLKDASKGAHLEVLLSAPHPDDVLTLAPLVAGEVSVREDGRRLSAAVDTSTGLATVVVRALDAAGVLVDNIEVRQPSLDDVFFSLTGEHVEEVVVGEDGGDPSSDGAGGAAGAGAGAGGKGRATSELEGANA